MIYAMTMATENYMPSALFQLETARKKGKVDKTICYNIDKDIDEQFRKYRSNIYTRCRNIIMLISLVLTCLFGSITLYLYLFK